MKKHLNLFLTTSLLFLLVFTSCVKEEVEPEEPSTTTTGTPAIKSIFKYNVNGGTTITADSAVYYPKFTTIYSYKDGTLHTIEINLSDLSVGTYSISTVTGNALTYVSSGKTFTANGGVVKITSNSSSVLGGDFNCSLTGGTLTSIGGQFSELRHR